MLKKLIITVCQAVVLVTAVAININAEAISLSNWANGYEDFCRATKMVPAEGTSWTLQ